MGLADMGPAQEIDARALQRRDDHVLVAVRLLLPAVMRGLFFRVLRPLAPPFGPVDDELRGRRLTSGETMGVPLRQDAQMSMDPNPYEVTEPELLRGRRL
jgi:hypothetical protein